MDWFLLKDKRPPNNKVIEVEIQHCNASLNLNNKIARGKIKDDGFYFNNNDGQLSYNWDIIKWRLIK